MVGGTRRRWSGHVPTFVIVLAFVTACSSASVPLKPAFTDDTGQENLIVLVHGIVVDQDATWRNGTTGAYWPELTAQDPAFKDFDVQALSYDSPLHARTSTIEEIVP